MTLPALGRIVAQVRNMAFGFPIPRLMRRPGSSIGLLLLVGCWSHPSVTDRPLTVFVEQGACPGEGCSYGVWRTTTDVSLRELPGDSFPLVDTIREGRLVCALTGEVHTTAGQFVVERQRERYEAGDTILVYTYRGEGHFLVEFDGVQFEEDLGFSPWGGSPGERCERGPECWGTLDDQLDFDWWIQMDDLAGASGWIAGTDRLDTRIVGSADPGFFAECDRRRSAAAQTRRPFTT